MSSAEQSTALAALILADDGVAITADKLQTLVKAANVEVEPIWTQLFAKALEGKDVKEMLLNVGSAGGAAPAAAAGGASSSAATGGDAAAEEKKEEKAEEKEESDEDVCRYPTLACANMSRWDSDYSIRLGSFLYIQSFVTSFQSSLLCDAIYSRDFGTQ